MDPASAFGFAVNVLTVVDFCFKVLSAASEIRTTGTTVTAADRLSIVKDLESCCRKLGDDSSIARDDSALCGLACEARLIAADIERSLLQRKVGHTPLGSMRDAFLQIWGERRMRDKMSRLETIRNELQFRIIVSMRDGIQYSSLKNSIALERLQNQTHNLPSMLEERMDNIDRNAELYHAEIIESLAIGKRMQEDNNSSNRQGSVTEQILSALWVSSISDRHDDIENAHENTFDWILPNQTFLGQQSCDFSEWIESNNGLYLLSGRAGTGKSTLMKYIAAHPQITEAFQRWAGCHELIMATYWFWDRQADGLQNSLQGLLQGLLFEIIKRIPSYGSLLFPDHHFVTRSGWQRDFPTLHELKRAFKRLASAQPSPAYVAILIDGLDECEGEFQDRVKIVELLTQAAVSTHIKVVVSSRPDTAFEVTLQGCNRLQLHHLTQRDIQRYVTDTLSSHPRVPYLKSQHRGQEAFYDLIQAIVSKSEGVFLWLRLVVQSLMEHLNDCNTIQDLHQVVDVFPEGLQTLYFGMMRRIRTDYRPRGYQLLQLARRNIALSETLTPWYYATADKTLPEPPSHCLTAICISLAHGDTSTVLSQEIASPDPETLKDTKEKVDNRLRSWCAGLLETRGPSNSSSDRSKDLEVHFLHRSVAEFLDRPEVHLEIMSTVQETHFETDKLLVMGFLARLKTCTEVWRNWNIGCPSLEWNYIEIILRLARHANDWAFSTTCDILDELDRIMTFVKTNYWTVPGHWSEAMRRRFEMDHWTNYFPWNNQWAGRGKITYYGDKVVDYAASHPTFVSFAMSFGLAEYAISKLRTVDQASMIRMEGQPLLSSVCRPPPALVGIPGAIRPEIISHLLKLGADPNRAYASITHAGASTTPWKEMLTTLHDLRIVCIKGAQQLADIVTSMVISGADPNAEVSFEERSARSSASHFIKRKPLQLIQYAFIDKLETPQTALYEGLVYHDDLLKEFRPCTRSRWGTYVGNFVPFESLRPDWTVSEYPWINHFSPLQIADSDATRLGPTELDGIKYMGCKLMDLLRSKGAVADVPDVTAQQRRRHLAYYRPWLARRFGRGSR